MSLLRHAPQCTIEQAASLARKAFGWDVVRTETLHSERDANFLVTDAAGRRAVLKISNAAEDPAFLRAQADLLDHLRAGGVTAPRIFAAANGEPLSSADLPSGRHAVRLVSYLEGPSWAETGRAEPSQLASLGSWLARLALVLGSFDRPALHRSFVWNLAEADSVVADRLALIDAPGLRDGVEQLLDRYRGQTLPLTRRLPQSVIHNDANDGNIILGRNAGGEWECLGLIDYGDAVHGWTISDLAIAMAYAVLDREEPLEAAAEVVRGYHAVRSLSGDEFDAVYGLMCLRLCLSAALAAEQSRERPEDPYLTVSQAGVRRVLPILTRIPFGVAARFLRFRCGLPPVAAESALLARLRDPQLETAFPLQLMDAAGERPSPEQIMVLDWSVETPLLDGPPEEWTEPVVTAAVQRALQQSGAGLGIGRYLEPRLLYAAPQFAGGGKWWDPRRTLHLGVDLFADAGVEVRAAVAGEVVASERIDRDLDYGGVLLLRHHTPEGEAFFTLYGHLNPESLKASPPGRRVAAGERLAELGDASCNGGWTPHLHFQIILDELNLGHEFPGVGYARQRDFWARLCPDPNLLLRLDTAGFPAEPLSDEATLAARRRLLGGNLSLAYRQPLKIVRGWRHYLFDSQARKYIDAYNNVPHVGHCHPRVVEAASRQMRLLNTNTRYLHELVLRLAEELLATMPRLEPGRPPLEVCYFVNSASEANELALRLCRAATGRRDVVVQQNAYHGHTCSLIDISPYKHAGPGGSGAPDWVHTAPIPDVYRGEFRDPASAGAAYAERVGQVLDRLMEQQRPPAAFIAETCPSVGGQIMPPDGFLPETYRRVRAAGGVCVADEVQTGYGRLGRWFYGFQQQQADPDIVVLGKPMGNGHPLAAVVATRSIAESFDNGMEFFSTFGGNPVSAAVGLAVLQAVREERLPDNAREVGDHLLEGLRHLQAEHPLMGDVRGAGFFLGVELVSDRGARTPAGEAARFISNRLKELGVLIGVDGPWGQVLKIRPPLTLSREDADVLLEALDLALGQSPRR